MPTLDEIRIRDPYVLPVAQENAYYLYGTTDATVGFDVYRSTDLITWEGPRPIFRPPSGFWGQADFWAPEVHKYRGQYYLFGSCTAPGSHRGTHIFVSKSPAGPFSPHGEQPVTPAGWECLDGTLFVDAKSRPWVVFCHEWVQVTDGEICAARLSDDLSHAVSEPVLLFRASDAPWTAPARQEGGLVTDGPWLHRTASGALLMLWSSFAPGRRYAESVARSTSGTLMGPWEQSPAPLYAEDGGHGMLFRTVQGALRLVLHAPNKSPLERAHILPVREDASDLICL